MRFSSSVAVIFHRGLQVIARFGCDRLVGGWVLSRNGLELQNRPTPKVLEPATKPHRIPPILELNVARNGYEGSLER